MQLTPAIAIRMTTALGALLPGRDLGQRVWGQWLGLLG